ncbi:MAG: DUF5330 domain-containing protein [Bradyrhizobium sp.]
MFFLLRLAFWLGLVLVLLPREKTPESQKLPQITASEAVQAASAAVSDMTGFCGRQPAACKVGGQAATIIGERAQGGARTLYQIMTDKTSSGGGERPRDAGKKASGADRRSPDHTGSIAGAANPSTAAADAVSEDTLTPQDLAVDWQGVP